MSRSLATASRVGYRVDAHFSAKNAEGGGTNLHGDLDAGRVMTRSRTLSGAAPTSMCAR